MQVIDREVLHDDIRRYLDTPVTTVKDRYNFLQNLGDEFGMFNTSTQIIELPQDTSPLIKHCLEVVYENRNSNIWLLVHVDRIEVGYSIVISDKEFITCQLDNVISIALVKQLIQKVPFNILFTTGEEHCLSYKQISFYFSRYHPFEENLKLIDLDIDVFDTLSQFRNGEITLRDRDDAGLFNSVLVKELRGVATKHDIPWLNKESWVIVQVGLLEVHTSYKGAYIGIPVIHYHTSHEITRWSSIINAAKLLYYFLHKNTQENNIVKNQNL